MNTKKIGRQESEEQITLWAVMWKSIPCIEQQNIKHKLLKYLEEENFLIPTKNDDFSWKPLDELKKLFHLLHRNDQELRSQYIRAWKEIFGYRLWTSLLVLRIITQKQLEKAIEIQKINHAPLWEILINRCWADPEEISSVLWDLEVIKLWEFLVHTNRFSSEEMKEFLDEYNIWEVDELFWKFLVRTNKITLKHLQCVFQELEIKLKLEDLCIPIQK